jgi:hypothetical protein
MKKLLTMTALAGVGAALVTGGSPDVETQVAGGKGGVSGGDVVRRGPAGELAGGKGGVNGGDVVRRGPAGVLVGGKGGISGGDVAR